MSVVSEQIRKAIFTKLSVTGVTNLATKGIHFMVAPDGTKAPFVVFSRVPKPLIYNLNSTLLIENDLWLIKAITDKDSHLSKSPVTLAEDILSACDSAIGESLTLADNVCLMARRVSEIPNYIETQADRNFYHHGFYLETYAE